MNIADFSTRELIDELEKALRAKTALLSSKEAIEKTLAECDNAINQNNTVIDTVRTELGVRNGVPKEQQVTPE